MSHTRESTSKTHLSTDEERLINDTFSFIAQRRALEQKQTDQIRQCDELHEEMFKEAQRFHFFGPAFFAARQCTAQLKSGNEEYRKHCMKSTPRK